jgi:hypothetical protein
MLSYLYYDSQQGVNIQVPGVHIGAKILGRGTFTANFLDCTLSGLHPS